MQNQPQCPLCGSVLQKAGKSFYCITCNKDFEEGGNGLLKVAESTAAEHQRHGARERNDYSCGNCHANIIAAGELKRCCFCGSRNIAFADHGDSRKADYILPFKVDARKAKKAFIRFFRRNPLIPECFAQAAMNGEITAVYMPIRLVSAELVTSLETQHGYGEASINFQTTCNDIPLPAGRVLNTGLFALLQPYNLGRLRKFKPEYLEGLNIEKHSRIKPDYFVKLKDDLDSQAVKQAHEILGKYKNPKISKISHHYNRLDISNAYVPVWVLNCKYENYRHQFFMNGQSGKIVGNPPPSRSRALAMFGILTAVLTVIGEIIYLAVSN